MERLWIGDVISGIIKYEIETFNIFLTDLNVWI